MSKSYVSAFKKEFKKRFLDEIVGIVTTAAGVGFLAYIIQNEKKPYFDEITISKENIKNLAEKGQHLVFRCDETRQYQPYVLSQD